MHLFFFNYVAQARRGLNCLALARQFEEAILVFADGVWINGVKHFGIRGDGKSIYGKKGNGGVDAVKTGQGKTTL